MSSKITDIDDEQVHFMYEVESMSLQEISDYYGVHKNTIYYRLHPEKNRERSKKYRAEHPEYDKQWRLEHPDKVKKRYRKVNANRRDLGSIELNISFPGSEGHHIDETYIIHIPKEIHRSIWHNVRTGEGMEDINTIAFRYITEEVFDKLIAGEI